MEKIEAEGCDYAYKHEGAEVGIKSYAQNANNHWIIIDIKTDKEEVYQFNFYDKFNANGSGAVETSALVTKEEKDGKKILLDTSEYENGSIITSVRAYDSDIITRGKKLLKKQEYEQLGLFELFDKYVPENMRGLEEKLKRSYTILPHSNERGY